MLYKCEGKIYCDAADLNLPEHILKIQLYRARQREKAAFQNIKNPYYNSRNSRRLVLLDSLPAELRKKVESHLRAAGIYHESALMELEEEGAPSEEITSTATQLRAEAVLKGQPVLKRALAGYLQNGYLPYLEHYLLQAQPHRAARRYARTCAWAQFICEQERFIAERSSPEEAELHLRSLHANLLHLLSQSDLEISVPRSEIYYQSWWRQLRDGLLQGKAPSECIATVRQGNQNSRKLHEPAQAYLKQLYCSGAAPPIMHIYRQLVAQARKQGWWTDAKGFRPPSYRTVALFLEHAQADLVLGRQGDAAQYAHYLPQIQRSVPTEEHAIWGADGTAHNELVFHNGRTRQYVYGVYVFDYATARLLACAPYNTAAGGSGERAEHYIEALSEAIRQTGHCPQVLQLDQGPAFAEVRTWCTLRDIKVIPAGAKNARAKVVEGLLGRLQSLVVRYRAGWSGQNLTASGPSAHPSPEQLKEHAKSAPSAAEAMAWMQKAQLEEYNQIALVTRGGQPCGRTPEELGTELSSATEPLPADTLAAYAGHCHRVKFTKAGLSVQQDGERYTYFPDVSSEASREQALALFAALKTRSPEGSKRRLYVLDYAAGAYVWTKDWTEEGRDLGFWPLQERVSMLETLGQSSQHFKGMRSLQRAQRKRAQDAAEAARWRPYEKTRLLGRRDRGQAAASERRRA